MQINKDKLPVLLSGEKEEDAGLFHHVFLDILPNVFGGKARTSSDVTKMEKFHQKHEKLRRDGGSG